MKIYIPVEVASREFHSRLLLSRLLVHQYELSVVFGEQNELLAGIDGPGIIFLKSAGGLNKNIIETCIKSGISPVVLDEEGVMPNRNEPGAEKRFVDEIEDNIAFRFLNGTLDFNLMPGPLKILDKHLISGNPRFDFYTSTGRAYFHSFEQRIFEKIDKNKPTILVISRFGENNSPSSVDPISFGRAQGVITNDAEQGFYESFILYSRGLFEHFLQLPKILAKEYPTYNIVVRPHPSEDLQTWFDEGFPNNVTVTNSFPIGAWLNIAAAMVHNGCTSSMEAAALGTPIVTFMPDEDARYDVFDANRFGVKARTYEEVCNQLAQIIEGNYCHELDLETLNQYSLFDNKTFASDRISKKIAELSGSVSHPRKSSKAASYRRLKFMLLKAFKDWLHERKLRHSIYRHKFPKLSRLSFLSEYDRIGEVFELNRCYVKRVGMEVYRLDPQNKQLERNFADR